MKHAFNPGPQDTEMVGGQQFEIILDQSSRDTFDMQRSPTHTSLPHKNKGEKSLMLDDLNEND